MKNKKKQMIITLIAIISLIVITVGVTYAFFNYSRTGTTDNVVKTGGITFLYTEVSGVGKGISLTEAYPVADSIGKVQVGEGKVFDFKVTSNISMNSSIGYQVTARKKTGSTLANSAVKVYLTEVNGTEQELLLSKYSELSQTDKVDSSKYDEKILYEATVPANTANYEKNFKLRMWVSDDTDFTDGSMNDRTFTLTVKSKVRGLGTKDLVVGKNTLPIRVIAEDGSEKVYNINITRKAGASLLKNEIMKNTVITANPTLTTSSNNTSDASGLYKSTATNTGKPTYYFRGNVENNYVNFAGFTWRIVRINEDGTVRLIMQDGINNNATYKFNSNYNNYTYMYYSNSEAKTTLESWYQTNIGSKSDLAKNVASGAYYCEQAKAKYSDSWTSGSATMTTYNKYTPDFKCATDGNGKGQVSGSVGLLTYDEVVYAGGYYGQSNGNYYLNNSAIYWWTMSPAGISGSYSYVWFVGTAGGINSYNVSITTRLRAVLNLTADIQISDGDGTKDNPFVVE